MDPNGHIYEAPEGEIPAEDKARLDGYLKAVEDAERRAQAIELLADVRQAAYEAKVREMEQRDDA